MKMFALDDCEGSEGGQHGVGATEAWHKRKSLSAEGEKSLECDSDLRVNYHSSGCIVTLSGGLCFISSKFCEKMAISFKNLH